MESDQFKMGLFYLVNKYQKGLEQNSFKNVSKVPAFLWQTQIQPIEYGLNDTIRIQNNEVILILYSFTPSGMNFLMILMPKVVLAKKIVREKLVPWNHSYLMYALISPRFTKLQ